MRQGEKGEAMTNKILEKLDQDDECCGDTHKNRAALRIAVRALGEAYCDEQCSLSREVTNPLAHDKGCPRRNALEALAEIARVLGVSE